MAFSGRQGPGLVILLGLPRRPQQVEQARQEPGQPGAEQTEVVAGGGEDEVGGVAFCAEEEVAAEMAVALQVADDGLDGAAAPSLAANGRGEAALLARDEHAGAVGIMAAVAAIDIGALDFDA